MIPDLSLTTEQQAIVDSEGHIFVNACPGSGKTRTMVALGQRVYERHGPRRGVAFTSFTNAAMSETRDRVAKWGLHALEKAPNYVGTFDSFLIRFVIGPDGTSWAHRVRPRFVERFDAAFAIPFTFQSKGEQKRSAAPLDLFVPGPDNKLMIEAKGASHGVKRSLEMATASTRTRLVEQAGKRIRAILKSGIVTPLFLRRDAMRKLTAGAACRVAERFAAIVVDEAQDCDDTDLAIIRAFRDVGSRCIVVGDLDQTIFRWRGASPQKIRDLKFAELPLTGNFRSSQTICSCAASLRSDDGSVDVSRGPHATDASPIHLLPYPTKRMHVAGVAFVELLARAGIDPRAATALAHQEKNALRAFGIPASSDVRTLADAFTGLVAMNDVDSRDRRVVCDYLEGVLAKSFGESDAPPSVERWIRLTARQVGGALVAARPAPADVFAEVRTILSRIEAPPSAPFVKPPKECFGSKKRPSKVRTPLGLPPSIALSTVHAAKGREFDAVLVVLPDETRTEDLLDAWARKDADHEGRAVLYVAATRARRVLAFAAPEQHADRLTELLGRTGAEVVRETLVSDP